MKGRPRAACPALSRGPPCCALLCCGTRLFAELAQLCLAFTLEGRIVGRQAGCRYRGVRVFCEHLRFLPLEPRSWGAGALSASPAPSLLLFSASGSLMGGSEKRRSVAGVASRTSSRRGAKCGRGSSGQRGDPAPSGHLLSSDSLRTVCASCVKSSHNTVPTPSRIWLPAAPQAVTCPNSGGVAGECPLASGEAQ